MERGKNVKQIGKQHFSHPHSNKVCCLPAETTSLLNTLCC